MRSSLQIMKMIFKLLNRTLTAAGANPDYKPVTAIPAESVISSSGSNYNWYGVTRGLISGTDPMTAQ